MPLPDDVGTFQQTIQSEPQVMALVEEVAEEAAVEESTGATRFDPATTALSLVVVAALWKLLGVGIGTLRSLSEEAAVKQRIELIRQLQEMGYDRQAPRIVERLLDQVRQRPEGDPVLKKLTELYEG